MTDDGLTFDDLDAAEVGDPLDDAGGIERTERAEFEEFAGDTDGETEVANDSSESETQVDDVEPDTVSVDTHTSEGVSR